MRNKGQINTREAQETETGIGREWENLKVMIHWPALWAMLLSTGNQERHRA